MYKQTSTFSKEHPTLCYTARISFLRSSLCRSLCPCPAAAPVQADTCPKIYLYKCLILFDTVCQPCSLYWDFFWARPDQELWAFGIEALQPARASQHRKHKIRQQSQARHRPCCGPPFVSNLSKFSARAPRVSSYHYSQNNNSEQSAAASSGYRAVLTPPVTQLLSHLCSTVFRLSGSVKQARQQCYRFPQLIEGVGQVCISSSSCR